MSQATLIAAGTYRDIFGSDSERMSQAYNRWKSSESEMVTAQLYGGALHGATLKTPVEPTICVCDTSEFEIAQKQGGSVAIYTYHLAIGDPIKLLQWTQDYGHYPYEG